MKKQHTHLGGNFFRNDLEEGIIMDKSSWGKGPGGKLSPGESQVTISLSDPHKVSLFSWWIGSVLSLLWNTRVHGTKKLSR